MENILTPQARFYQLRNDPAGLGWVRLAVATLSDAQEVLARGRYDDARKMMNEAKWMLAAKAVDELRGEQ